ncbi:MAG TPA: hypothetical protein VK809_08895 [Bacteroidia bacterium]|jgi:hypothetical protein|nr:hypothetical protein [Bacteroidia bacterium]
MEKVIITDLYIQNAGAIRSFQVKIPHNAICITGVNVTVTLGLPPIPLIPNPKMVKSVPLPPNFLAANVSDDTLPAGSPIWIGFTPSIFLGNMRMQSYGKANIFIAEDVYLQDFNIGQGDFSSISDVLPNDWSNKVKFERAETREDAAVTVLKGIYRDMQTPKSTPSYAYSVGVYIWYEINPNK